MKIDVEGYEYRVLQGAGELLKRCECLLLEYSPQALYHTGLSPPVLFELLRRAGLHAHRFEDNGRLRPVSFEQLALDDMQSDLLLMRS
jgi:hypothetical protein